MAGCIVVLIVWLLCGGVAAGDLHWSCSRPPCQQNRHSEQSEQSPSESLGVITPGSAGEESHRERERERPIAPRVGAEGRAVPAATGGTVGRPCFAGGVLQQPARTLQRISLPQLSLISWRGSKGFR